MQNRLPTSALCILLLTLTFSSTIASSGRVYVHQLGAAPKNLNRVIDTSLTAVIPGSPHSIAMTSSRDGNNEIYVMDANGDDQSRVATHTSNDQRPDISPDGKQIVFSSNRDGNFEIFIMDFDGNNVRQLTGTASPLANPGLGGRPTANGSRSNPASRIPPTFRSIGFGLTAPN